MNPGGRIVYSTCSTEPEEGESVVARFVGTHPEFALRQLAVRDGSGAGIANLAEIRTPEGFLRTWPHHGIGAHLSRCWRERPPALAFDSRQR